jgi:hypothetical protein
VLVQQENDEINVWKRKVDSEYNNSNLAEAEERKVFYHLNIKDQGHQIQTGKLLARYFPAHSDHPPTTLRSSRSSGSRE